MRFRSKSDKSAIIYNCWLTLDAIPPEAYAYQIGGRPAIEWIMDRYQDKTDSESQIRNNPNDWRAEDPRYILDLVKRIVRVSVETMKIINGLPPAIQ
jgi:predicted helicase